MKKRILSILLSLTVILGNITLLSLSSAGLNSTDNSQQIEYQGGWTPSSYETDGKLWNDKVVISKTVSATEDENYFDITLKILAKEQFLDQPVDVVVVMDNSNTMNATHENVYPGNTGYDVKDSRIYEAKLAINQFIDQYTSNANISQNRRFGLVTFNSYANTVIPLTTANSTSQADQLKATVNNITAPKDDRLRFTNIEGGLQLAYNLLQDSTATFKYIIFLTDGFPTTYIESGRTSTTQIIGYDTYTEGSYNASKVGTDGYFADSVSKQVCTYGVNYSDKAADKADDIAAIIKNDGINIFSIGIDVGVQTIPGYLSLATKTTHTTVDRTSTSYVIGTTTDTYRNWLGTSIAGGPQLSKVDSHRYAVGNDEAALKTAFANILKDIELIPIITMREAFTIDPMSDAVEFLHFYNESKQAATELTNSKNVTYATFNETYEDNTDVIKWILADTPYTKDGDVYTFTVSYKVRLKNEVDGFTPNVDLATNDTTTFNFKTVDDQGNPLYGDNHLEYTIPKVEGYLGDFTFTKTDSEGNPLEGAVFTLQHYGKSCHVCNGDAHIEDMTATSNENGVVTFANIPSGHEYVLIETQAPDGYYAGTNNSVHIAYGKTYFDGVEVTENSPVTIKNEKITPVSLTLSAQKTLTGRLLKDEEFTFVLEGVHQHGVKFHEKTHNDANGNVVFYPIIFDEVGTYNFTIREENTKDSTVIYDDTVYNVECIVTLNDQGTAYQLETKIDGVDVESDTTPSPVKFTNTLRNSVKVQLEALKTMDGVTPENGAFDFVLIDNDGQIIQTKPNNDGNVTFDQIEYSQVGTYTYTIKEDHGDDNSIHYDHSVYTATVTVTAPEDTDSFAAEVVYTKNGEAVETVLFENKTRIPATLQINAHKTLDGVAPAQGQFSYQLKNSDGQVVDATSNDENGNITFDTLQFTADNLGLNFFTINEVIEDNDNIIWDKTIYTVYVRADAHHLGDSYYLEVFVEKPARTPNHIVHEYGSHIVIEAESGINFSNYTRGQATVTLGGTKTLDGDIPEEGAFTFELLDENNQVIDATVNDANGNYQFKVLPYNSVGTYTYTVRELSDDNTDIVYDKTVYTVNVTITAPENTSEYFAEVEVNRISVNGVNAVYNHLDFNNLTRNNATVTLKGIKTLDGIAPEENQFTFILADQEGNIIDQAQNNSDGTYQFEALVYDEIGTYTYQVYESQENADTKYIYDDTIYTIVVNVTAPEDAHTYRAEVVAQGTSTIGDEVVYDTLNFANRTREAVEVVLTAEKTLDGKTPGKNDCFAFELEETNGDVVETGINIGRNVTFSPLYFDEEGTYTYIIRETKENEFIQYDEAVYTVNITVTAPEDDGAYTATVEYLKDGEPYQGTPLFANKTGEVEIDVEPEPQETDPTTGKDTTAPKTGDSQNLILWFVLLLASGIILTKVLFVKKNNK